MGGAEHKQQLRLLSAGDKAAIVEGLRAALGQSHKTLAETCSQYIREYHVSYECLRTLMDGALPNYLADLPVDTPGAGATEAIRLSNRQVAALLAAYRDALMGPRRHAVTESVIAEYALKYEAPPNLLRAIVKSNRRRHPAEYRALEHLGASADPPRPRRVVPDKTKKSKTLTKKPSVDPLQGKPVDVSVSDYVGRATYCPDCRQDFDANYIPIHRSGANRCRGSERFAVSLYTLYLQGRHLPDSGPRRWAPTVAGGLPGLGRRR